MLYQRSPKARPWYPLAAAVAALLILTLPLAAAPQEESVPEEDRVRVVNAHTNVHAGANTFRPVLVLAPKDTVFDVVGRQGEWLEVELFDELRDTGMVMRWYEDEERGWVHQSQVETVEDR